MYSVSEEFLSQLNKHTRVEHIRGTIGTATFDDTNVLSMELSNRCSDTSDVTFGSVYVGQLKASFVNVSIARGSWKGQTITLEWGMELEDETTEWIPIGEFEVASAEWTDQGVNITANDNVMKLDKDLATTTISAGKLYVIASYACSQCGLTLGMTEEECDDLPNGTEVLGLYAENDVKTYRDMFSWLAQVIGGFVTADRDGSIVFRSFRDSEVVDRWSAAQRIFGSVFSDYATYYDGISIVNMEDETLSYVSAGTGDGGVIKLGSNPFLQYGLDSVKEEQRMRIAIVAHSIEWTPFTASTLSNLIYDLGDLVECTAGVAGSETLTCGLLAYTWTFKNTTKWQGYGADPTLTTGQSKTDKNISGLISKIDSATMTYYSYENAFAIEVGEEVEVPVASIQFAAKKMTDVVIQCEFKIDTTSTAPDTRTIVYNDIEPEDDPETEEDESEGDPIVTPIGYFDKLETPIVAHVRYYYDGVLVGYEPIDTWTEAGYHMFSGFYHLRGVDIEQLHTWRVTLELADGEGVIDITDAHLLISGQGLVGELPWDGKIDIEDTLPVYNIKTLTSVEVEESGVAVSLSTPTVIDVSDVLPVYSIKALSPIEIEEGRVSVVLRNIVYNLVSEDGEYNIVSEDKNYNITTEGNNE